MATVADNSGELREDVPLKTGTKTSRFYMFKDDCLGGSKFINFSFGTLTLAITVALLFQIYYGDYQVVPHGSVATDSRECSEIGTSILKAGGNAVDAAIASAFCLALVNPHITGLDAQGQILIYNHKLKLAPSVVDFSNLRRISDGVPRLVSNLAYIHQQYGLLPWKDLLIPSVNLARKGFLVSKTFALAISNYEATGIFGPLEAGHVTTALPLANTLENIATLTPEDLSHILQDGSVPMISQAIQTTFKDYYVYAPKSQSIGPYLLVGLEYLSQLNVSRGVFRSPSFVINLAKTASDVYRSFAGAFHNGTSTNIAVIDTDDQYVSLIIGMHAPFGSKRMTPYGYLLDVDIQDNLPPSRIPLIVTNKPNICGRRLVFGANSMDLAMQIIASLVIGNENVTTAIEAPRFKLLDNTYIGLEASHGSTFDEETITQMETIWKFVDLKEPYNSCNIVEKIGDHLNSHSDSRGDGISSRF